MKPFRSFIPPLAAMLMAASGGASAQGVLIDKSEIRFVSKQMGVNVEGRFRKWKANLDFRPKEPAKSKAEIEIDLASIDLASEESEAELRRPLWFDTAKFPVAKFVSTGWKDLGGDRYEISGTLSIKGTARNVVVPVALGKDAAGNSVAAGPVRGQAPRVQRRRGPVGGHRRGRQRGHRSRPHGVAARPVTAALRQRPIRACMRLTAATSSCAIPGSRIEWPASGTTTYSASGQARARVSAVTIGHTMS